MQTAGFLDSGPQQCNSSAVVLRDAAEACKLYIDSLQTCAVQPVNEQTKFQIVNQTANCIGLVWESDANSALYSSYISELGSPPPLTINESCTYPDFMPILQNTCAFDLNQVNFTCTDSDTYAWYLSQYISCSTETTLQYWRCTQQKPQNDVATCVEENAVKVDWIPQFQLYDGANDCPKTTSYLVRQGGTILTDLLSSTIPSLFILLRQKEPLRSEDRYVLKPSNLLRSIGGVVLTAYLTVLINHKSHVTGIVSVTEAFWQAILLYVIRPRVAPFTGFLGFWHGFSETGLADLFADGMLSWVAGTSLLLRYWYIFLDPPLNPAAPLAALRILGLGAILSSLPAFGFLALVLVLSFFMGRGPLGGFFVFMGFLAIITLFLCFLPVLAVIEMIAKTKSWIRSLGKKTPRIPSKWEEMLSMNSRVFRIAYALMWVSSIVINVGNWMFFVKFLQLQGDMFCPSDFNKVTAVWFLVPFLVNLIFFTFKGLTTPTGSASSDGTELQPFPM